MLSLGRELEKTPELEKWKTHGWEQPGQPGHKAQDLGMRFLLVQVEAWWRFTN